MTLSSDTGKPPPIHFFLAHGFQLSAGIGVLCVASSLFIFCSLANVWSTQATTHWSIIVACLASFPLGWLLGAILLWPIVALVARKLNGAPYNKGDLVYILIGEKKHTISRIYEVWNERHQVRVDLGDSARQNINDVYSYHEICRIP